MTEKHSQHISRRRFLLWTSAGGLAVAAGVAIPGLLRDENDASTLAPDTALIRNPAYQAESHDEGLILRTTTTDGVNLQYMTDKEGSYLWEAVATKDEADAGKRTTVGDVLDTVLAREREDSGDKARREATAFITEVK